MGIVYLGYLSGAAVASGSAIPMNTIIRRHCMDTSTNEVLNGKGYYKVTVNATLSSTAGGLANIVLQQNGVNVVGATASETINANGTTHISFTSVVRNTCCDPTSQLQLVYSGPVLTGTFASMVIENA